MITIDELSKYVTALKMLDKTDLHLTAKSLVPFNEAGVILAIPQSEWEKWEADLEVSK